MELSHFIYFCVEDIVTKPLSEEEKRKALFKAIINTFHRSINIQNDNDSSKNKGANSGNLSQAADTKEKKK